MYETNTFSPSSFNIGTQDGKVVINTDEYYIKLPLRGTIDSSHNNINNFIEELHKIDGVEEVFEKYGFEINTNEPVLK